MSLILSNDGFKYLKLVQGTSTCTFRRGIPCLIKPPLDYCNKTILNVTHSFDHNSNQQWLTNDLDQNYKEPANKKNGNKNA